MYKHKYRTLPVLHCARATNSVVGDGILTIFKLIQVFMVALVTCKNEEDSSKNEGTRVVKTFLPLQVYGSVELPKTTHLPKTTENHLENHIYKGIIPS